LYWSDHAPFVSTFLLEDFVFFHLAD